MDKNVAFIPVRGGSKSIKDKNIKIIAGKPMVFWSIDAACACSDIHTVYVSTDSDKVREVVERYDNEKVVIIDRTQESATDTAPIEISMLEFAENYDFDNIILMQATSPLIEAKYITEGLEKIAGEYDSILSVVPQKRFFWDDSIADGEAIPVNYDPLKRPNRQDVETLLAENGAIYITSKRLLLESSCRISGKIGVVKMPEESYYEISEQLDFNIVENILVNRKKTESPISKIKAVFTDCDGILTDGGMYISENGDETKKFHARDGMGFKLLKENGYITGMITGEYRKLLKTRGDRIKVNELYMGIEDKKIAILNLAEKYNLKLEEIAYIGDDINDIEVLDIVGLSATAADGDDAIKDRVHFITERKGGQGAFREFAEYIISYKVEEEKEENK